MSIDLSKLGNPRFIELVESVLDTHRRKAAGYSGSDNPDTWSNFREATAWGLTPLEGCLVRMGDKYRRVQNLRRNAANDQVGESIKDTLLDLANYAIIAVCLMEEEEAARQSAPVPTVDAFYEALKAGGNPYPPGSANHFAFEHYTEQEKDNTLHRIALGD